MYRFELHFLTANTKIETIITECYTSRRNAIAQTSSLNTLFPIPREFARLETNILRIAAPSS